MNAPNAADRRSEVPAEGGERESVQLAFAETVTAGSDAFDIHTLRNLTIAKLQPLPWVSIEHLRVTKCYTLSHIVTVNLYNDLPVGHCAAAGPRPVDHKASYGVIPSDPKRTTQFQRLTIWDRMGSKVSRLGSRSGYQKVGGLPRFFACAACVGCAFSAIGQA